jgi:hypothetical protein
MSSAVSTKGAGHDQGGAILDLRSARHSMGPSIGPKYFRFA